MLIEALSKRNEKVQVQPPKFAEFNPSTELITDYFARFHTFVSARSVSEEKRAQFFLTSHSPVTYKTICNLASQMSTPVNQLNLSEIENFMMDHFHPKRFLVRERDKFWTGNSRQEGETIQELAARIRQDAVTRDSPSISNPLDVALKTRLMCCIDNEAVLKALFKAKIDDLTFAKAIEIATQIKYTAKCAKDTMGHSYENDVQKVNKRSFKPKI